MKKLLIIVLILAILPIVLASCLRILRISGMVHESLLRQQVFRFVL